MTIKFFKIAKKKLFWGHFWSFLSEFGQKGIVLEKISLCQFLNISFIYHCAKNQKNYSAIPEKNATLMDGKADRWIGRQQ